MPRLKPLATLSALWLTLLFATGTGCADCADYGEYCTDLDCCEDLACVFVETEGYRCR